MQSEPVFQDVGIYQIKVRGLLDERWLDWFDGFTLITQAENLTLLVGQVQDQGALHGILAKIRDLGLVLLSVEQIEEYPAGN